MYDASHKKSCFATWNPVKNVVYYNKYIEFKWRDIHEQEG